MDSHNVSTSVRIRRVFELLSFERRDILAVALYSTLVGILSLIVPVASNTLFTNVAFGTVLQPIAVLTFLVLLFLLIAAVLRTVKTYAVELIQRRLFSRLSYGLANHLQRMKAESFDNENMPEIVNRFFEILTLNKIISLVLLDGLSVILQTVIGLVLLAVYHPYLLAFDFILLISMYFIVVKMSPKAIETSIEESKSKYRVAEWLEEITHNPITFSSKSAQDFSLKRIDKTISDYIQKRQTHFKILIRQFASIFLIQAFANAALLGLGGWLVMKGQLSLGQLVAAEIIVSALLASLSKMGKYFEAFYDVVTSVDKLHHIFDISLTPTGPEPFKAQNHGMSMALHNISYTYKNSVDTIQNLNLKIKAQSKVFIQGVSGSGKSTLAQILALQRIPNSGRIEIDEQDLRLTDVYEIRNNIAYLAHVEIFPGTIADNLKIGRDITTDLIQKTLTLVGLYDFIMNLPQGLNTKIEGHFGPFSKTMANRLMVARAILSKPKLVILDGLFDGMDEETQIYLINILMTVLDQTTFIHLSRGRALAHLYENQYRLNGQNLEPFEGASHA